MNYMEDFLARLQKGENADDIAKELTQAINDANKEYKRLLEEQERFGFKQLAATNFIEAAADLAAAYELDEDIVNELENTDINSFIKELDGLMDVIQEYGRLFLQEKESKTAAKPKSSGGDSIEDFLNKYVR